MHFYERRLPCLCVLSCGFSEGRGVGSGVEDVVDDLEGEAELATGFAQRRAIGFAGALP